MGPNSLDALCRRYGIDNSHRTKHGALLDSELLAEVYIELIGGKQAALGLESTAPTRRAAPATVGGSAIIAIRARPTAACAAADGAQSAPRMPRLVAETRRKGDLEPASCQAETKNPAGRASWKSSWHR